MAHIINSHPWTLPTAVIEAASLEGTKNKLKYVYLSNVAKKGDTDFLFFKDEDRKEVAFIIDKDKLG